jgi:hypothetical protein
VQKNANAEEDMTSLKEHDYFYERTALLRRSTTSCPFVPLLFEQVPLLAQLHYPNLELEYHQVRRLRHAVEGSGTNTVEGVRTMVRTQWRAREGRRGDHMQVAYPGV